MKYAVGMGSSVIVYIPNFTRIVSGIQKLTGEGAYTDTQKAWRLQRFTFIFFSK
jgi:hypothetical protein